MGASTQHECRRSDETIPGRGGNQSLRRAGGDRRPAGIHGIAGSEMDGGHLGSNGRRRNQGHLKAAPALPSDFKKEEVPMPHLLSVNVGLPREVTWNGKTVRTAIWKFPVEGRRMVRKVNIDGDGQA